MRVRCKRIFEGGRVGGRELADHPVIHVGGEYVVLAIATQEGHGASYMVLRDDRPYAPAVWPAGMFDVVDGAIPTSWLVRNPHEAVVTLEPAAWGEPAYIELDADGDPAAFEIFKRETDLLLAEDAAKP